MSQDGSFRRIRESEVNFCFGAILKAPANESPWRYLEGIYDNSWEDMIADAENLLRFCGNILKSDPKCVQSFRFIFELVSRGANVNFLDLEEFKLGSTKLEVCEGVCELLKAMDPIRMGYWEFRKKLVLSHK